MNIEHIRKEFPILEREVNGKKLVYLDNGATSQTPKSVINAIVEYYELFNANVHRGIHTLSQEATLAMELSRAKVQKFINAKETHEIIFTSGTTDSINLLAYALEGIIKENDEILITELEHHSNIVPWQMLCKKTKAKLKYIPLKENGVLNIDLLDDLISENTKLVSINHVSNALGVINPIKKVIDKAHEFGAFTLIDGAQSIPHLPVDIQYLDADFYAFSGHKMYAPTGTGVLYGKENILTQLEPYRGGGEMIETVNMCKTTYAGLPFKYEAGTPNICGNIALGHAIDFMQNIGLEKISIHEQALIQYTIKELSKIEEIEIYAKETPRSGAISFNMNSKHVHSSDIGMILDKFGIAVRTGHHCCQPIMNKLKIKGTVRASFAAYNNKEDVDKLISGLKTAITMLK